MRAFIAIEIGEKKEIVELLNELKKLNARMKLVEPHNIHLTLKFLGEIEEKMVEKIEEVIKESVKEIEPFEAELKDIGVFPNMSYMRVLWIGFKDNGITKKIADYINEELQKYGFKKEKDFVPHVTLARIKSKEGKEEIKKFIEKNRNKSFGWVSCNSIHLKKSILRKEGPIYETISEIEI